MNKFIQIDFQLFFFSVTVKRDESNAEERIRTLLHHFGTPNLFSNFHQYFFFLLTLCEFLKAVMYFLSAGSENHGDVYAYTAVEINPCRRSRHHEKKKESYVIMN